VSQRSLAADKAHQLIGHGALRARQPGQLALAPEHPPALSLYGQGATVAFHQQLLPPAPQASIRIAPAAKLGHQLLDPGDELALGDAGHGSPDEAFPCVAPPSFISESLPGHAARRHRPFGPSVVHALNIGGSRPRHAPGGDAALTFIV